ncbi:MAG: 16S rRNA (uracil(1498)-N(3))-methyltransferase [Colwellia sp.]|nr:16S rRNA (uracil(1498)-N(3))-methyltransferase [Colwellia sp.]
MSNPRIYQHTEFLIGQTYALNDDTFGHTVRVLRLKEGDAITVFNGLKSDGCYGEFQGQLVNVSKKHADVLINYYQKIDIESPLNIHLAQGISRGDRMDFTLQKSVELGVNTITPIFTERCGVKLNSERLAKKHEQWQKIVISACEQSGRCTVPIVNQPISLQEWLAQPTSALKINLHPKAKHSIMNLPVSETSQQVKVRLLIGPEGGLSDDEIKQANDANFIDVLLGPRVLRTETAALTAITALQCRFGDLT